MPLPMVHLAVAVRIHGDGDSLPTPAFLLGNLAPDAIHMRPNANRDDKRRTHLLDPSSQAWDHDVIREFCVGQQLGPGSELTALDRERREFLLGYAAHLLTDSFWSDLVYEPFVRKLPAGTSPEEKNRIYYTETDQIDIDIHRSSAWRPKVWELLSKVDAPEMDGLLTAEEIGKWRDRVLGWYTPDKEPKIQVKYITHRQVAVFIDEAAASIRALFAEWDVLPSGQRSARQ
ncbi:MAG: zinc dependent phospholipase C family protein [Bacteroidota bacterium]